jgi:hypothetical protein
MGIFDDTNAFPYSAIVEIYSINQGGLVCRDSEGVGNMSLTFKENLYLVYIVSFFKNLPISLITPFLASFSTSQL